MSRTALETEGIELFVHAAKVGLFEMQWLLICAYCPQVAGSFRELDQVHPRFQCEFCNALNDVALDDYIQVTFTVSSAVRDINFLTEQGDLETASLRIATGRKEKGGGLSAELD